MPKVIVIKDLGRIEKKPIWGDGFHYEIQEVEYEGKQFFRRQKIKDGKVSSSSYANSADSKKWVSALYEIVKSCQDK